LYMRPIGHIDWIGFGSAFTSSLWSDGLGLENWTYVQLWAAQH